MYYKSLHILLYNAFMFVGGLELWPKDNKRRGGQGHRHVTKKQFIAKILTKCY